MAAADAGAQLAERVLACPSFDSAQRRFPEVIRCAFAAARCPPEQVFRAHWAPGTKHHASLCKFIAHAAAAADATAKGLSDGLQERSSLPADCIAAVGAGAERRAGDGGDRRGGVQERAPAPAPPPVAPVQVVRADHVLGCASFDEARNKYPEVMSLALKDAPAVDVFRTHWAPSAEYHASLRKVIEDAVDAVQATVARSTQDKVTIVRATAGGGGEFWGFLMNKEMKVIDIMKGSPAEKCGLKKGVYIHEVRAPRKGSSGPNHAPPIKCTKPSDAYGHSLDNQLELTVGSAPLSASSPPPGVEPSGAVRQEVDAGGRLRVAPRVMGSDAEKDRITEEIRRKAKADRAFRDAWKRHCDLHSSGMYDPAMMEYPALIRALSHCESAVGEYQPQVGVGFDIQAPREIVVNKPTGPQIDPSQVRPRPAIQDDKVMRADGREAKDGYGWILPAGAVADVVLVWHSNDERNGEMRVRHRHRESEWMPWSGWKFANDNAEYGCEVIRPTPRGGTNKINSAPTPQDSMWARGVKIPRRSAVGEAIPEAIVFDALAKKQQQQQQQKQVAGVGAARRRSRSRSYDRR